MGRWGSGGGEVGKWRWGGVHTFPICNKPVIDYYNRCDAFCFEWLVYSYRVHQCIFHVVKDQVREQKKKETKIRRGYSLLLMNVLPICL